MILQRVAFGAGEVAVMEQHEIFFQFFARIRCSIAIRHIHLLGEFRQALSERRHRAVQVHFDRAFRGLH